MFFRFEADVPLRWVDIDSAGVVNNAVYLSMMEQARFAYFEHLGLLQEHRVPYVLAEASVTFLKPGRLGMPIQVATRTNKLGSTSFHMDYEVRSGDLVLARGRAVLVFVDAAMQPRPIPTDVRETVAQFEELGAD